MEHKRACVNSEEDLIKVQPFPLARYENEQLAALAVYSVHWLIKWGVRPSLEAIIVLNHRLFPLRFSMDLFPQFPDAPRTQRSLMQGGPKYRGWVSGSHQKGFVITPSGQMLVEELLRRVGYPQVGGLVLGQATEEPKTRTKKRKETARNVDFKSEVVRLRESRLFEKWTVAPLSERDLIHVYSAFGIFDHTPISAKRRRLRELTDSAKKVGDEKVGKFLKDVEMSFPSLFRD